MPMLLMRMKGPVLALAVALLLVFLWPTLAGWAGAAEGSLGAQLQQNSSSSSQFPASQQASEPKIQEEFVQPKSKIIK